MKYLGIDYGARRVGIAVSDPDGVIAFPRIVAANDARLHVMLEELIAKEGIEHIVIGDTRTASGIANPVTQEADAFAERLARKSGVQLSRVSEAWSSVEVSRLAPPGSEHDDAAAAAFILQRFLDMRAKR